MFKSLGRLTALGLLALLALGAVTTATAGDLQGEIEKVGETYARAYLAPFMYSFGPNLNSGIFHTAAIPKSRLTLDFGVKAMGTKLNDADKAFSVVINDVDLHDYDSSVVAGTMGDIVMSGPTIYGNDATEGSVAGYVDGMQVFSNATITGLIESSLAPMAAPQASLGGIAGLRLTVRYLPEIDAGDVGKVKLFGYGGSWSANSVMPTLPVDVMVGYFTQSFDVGTLVNAEATSMYVAASRSFSLLTLYGGYAKESSEMTIAYAPDDGSAGVSFTVDDGQESRITVGATLNVLAKLNVEMGHGDLTTYTAGLMFGF